ncbi:MAG: LamG-like jellyroll fold domain-containing protein [Nanoarchaeota archaeon]
MRRKSKIVITLVFFICLVIIAMSSVKAIGPLPIYLQDPIVPDSPLSLQSRSETDVYTGAFTQNFPIQLPLGTNGLKPSLSLYYNSHMFDSPRQSLIGNGWDVQLNYIERRTNYTASNISDDYYVIVFNGIKEENLIYDPVQRSYETKIRNFFYISNLSGGQGTGGLYWTVKTGDGSIYRFGYWNNSLLKAGLYNYTSRWYLDLVNDTYGNQIFYNYSINPYANDSSAVYPLSIEYNNDRQRKIEFVLTSVDRIDKKTQYIEGSFIRLSRAIKEVRILANGSLVRKYDLGYNGTDYRNLLINLTEFGSNNSLSLSPISFNYSSSSKNFTNINSQWSIPSGVFFHIGWTNGGSDTGVRLADINRDGKVDLLKAYCNSNTYSCYQNPNQIDRAVWLNNGSGWTSSNLQLPPIPFGVSYNWDSGARIIDINGDGFTDIVQTWIDDQDPNKVIRETWLNNGTAFINNTNWSIESDIFFHMGWVDGGSDTGIRIADLNGDSLPDLAKSYCNNPPWLCSNPERKVWINTGKGWRNDSGISLPPVTFRVSNHAEPGTFINDLNGDGLADVVQYWRQDDFSSDQPTQLSVWLNNGSGFNNFTSNWSMPSEAFYVGYTNGGMDNGVRLIDINGDNLIDVIQARCYSNTRGCYDSPGLIQKNVWLNNGKGWVLDQNWSLPDPIALINNYNWDPGTRMADINGDGITDFIQLWQDGSDEIKDIWINNGQKGYILQSVKNQFGGITRASYKQSTLLNNTGVDTLNDIGFNLWVVENISKDNGLNTSHKVIQVARYNYVGALYEYPTKEYRGFAYSRENLSEGIIKEHYFLQEEGNRGQEYLIKLSNKSGSLYTTIYRDWKLSFSNGLYKLELKNITELVYDGLAINPRPRLTVFNYDQFGNIIVKQLLGDPQNLEDDTYEYFEYATNNSTWIINKVKNYTLYGSDNQTKFRQTLYYYDNLVYGGSPTKGSITKKEEWLSGGTNPLTFYGYDSHGNLINSTDALGRVTKYIYGLRDPTNTFVDQTVNSKGHVSNYIYNLGTGNILSEIDQNGFSHNYTYDSFGRITNEISPYDSFIYPTINYVYEFDGIAPEKIIIKKREQNASVQTLDEYRIYDGFERTIQTKKEASNSKQIQTDIYYDESGRIAYQSNPYSVLFNANYSAPNSSVNRTQYIYDALNRIIRIINSDGSNKRIEYSAFNITYFDENNNKKITHIDSYEKIIAINEFDNAESYSTQYIYDGAGILVSIIDSQNHTTNYTYNSLGRKIYVKDPDIGIWNYTYDSVGNLILQKDNRNKILIFSYDSLNRKISENSSTNNITYVYDENLNGTLSRIQNSFTIINYTYDNRLRKLKENILVDQRTFSIEYDYDSLNRITYKSLPSGENINYTYDEQGLTSELKGLINISYNEVGNPSSIIYYNGDLTNYTYDLANFRLKRIQTSNKQDLSYQYDQVGNILEINDSVNNRSTSLTYDDLNRLTRSNISTSVEEDLSIFNYNSIGNMLNSSSKVRSIKFFYNNSRAHAPYKVIFFDAAPSISFASPTPLNGTSSSSDSIYVNISSSDNGIHYTFADFNSDVNLWMRMDDLDTSNDFVDLSTYSLNGSRKGNTLTSTGKFGNSISLDGNGDYIYIPADKSKLPHNKTTISAWIKPSSNISGDNYRTIVGTYTQYQGSNKGGYGLRIISEGTNYSKLEFFYWNGSKYNTLVGNSTIQLGSWNLATATYDGQTIKLYLNGQEDGSYIAPEGFIPMNDLYIGALNFSTTGIIDYWNGSVDEVLMFRRALSGNEISSIYNAKTNQYYHEFTSLLSGSHNFIGYAVDAAGNKNQTEKRTVNLYSIIDLTNLSVIYTNNRQRVFRFVIFNNYNTTVSNISWSLDNGQTTQNSQYNASLQSGEDLFVYTYYNYTSTGNYTVMASTTNGQYSDSESIQIQVI